MFPFPPFSPLPQVWLGYDAIKKGLCDELRTSDDVLLDMIKSDAVVLRLSYQIPPKGLLGRLRQGDDPDSDSSAAAGGMNEELLSVAAQLARALWGRSSFRSSSPLQPSLSYEDQDRVMIATKSHGENEEEW
jgi:ClpP class serine protease